MTSSNNPCDIPLSEQDSFHPVFKKEKKNTLTLIDSVNRVKLREYKKIFTLTKLLGCRKAFHDYLDKNGGQAPIHTSYSWFNKALNYTLSFTYYIATNQEYASQVLEEIQNAKLHTVDCDLLLSFVSPIANQLKNFPIQQNSAYVRVGNSDGEKLFYINKTKDIVMELKLKDEKLKLFDTYLNPTTKIKALSNADLIRITGIIGHKHQKPEHIAVFHALKNIKKIHSEMESRRIYGRVRNAIEETLKTFDLPLNEKEFAIEEDAIIEVFEVSKKSNENKRIHYSP